MKQVLNLSIKVEMIFIDKLFNAGDFFTDPGEEAVNHSD